MPGDSSLTWTQATSTSLDWRRSSRGNPRREAKTRGEKESKTQAPEVGPRSVGILVFDDVECAWGGAVDVHSTGLQGRGRGPPSTAFLHEHRFCHARVRGPRPFRLQRTCCLNRAGATDGSRVRERRDMSRQNQQWRTFSAGARSSRYSRGRTRTSPRAGTPYLPPRRGTT